MGGVTVATCATTHSEDIRGTILQYPAIFLNEQAYEVGAEYDVNRFENTVLLLQGDNDKIVAKNTRTSSANTTTASTKIIAA